MIVTILIGGCLAMILLGAPMSMAMLVPTAVALVIGDYPLANMAKIMASSVESFPLMAVPFFILAGNLMNVTGVTDRIFDFAHALVGHIRGGLAQVNIVASMIFAGMTGAAVADCAGLGTIEIKAMSERGYDRAFSAAVTVASSTIGPIFPPSVIMIIYAIQAEVSIARMFLAGVVPGILIGLVLMVAVYLMASFGRYNCPVDARASARQMLCAFAKAIPALLVPLIILVGMVGGVVTPTEAGIVAIVYSLFLGFAFGDLRPSNVVQALVDSVLSTAMILFIVAVASLMGWVFAIEGASQVIAGLLFSLTSDKYLMLFLINVFLLILGTVLEGIPALLITVPILLPIVTALKIDPVHFGIIISLNLVIGLATPPVGISLFILTRIANITFGEMSRAIMPMLIPLLVALLIVTYVPALSLFLPDLVMGPAR